MCLRACCVCRVLSMRVFYQNRFVSAGTSCAMRNMTIFDVKLENYEAR